MKNFIFFFSNPQRGGGVDFRPPPLAYATGAHLRDVAPGETQKRRSGGEP